MDLKTWRKRKGWSQVQLAEALGVHPMTISKWERGVVEPTPYLHLALERLEEREGKATYE